MSAYEKALDGNAVADGDMTCMSFRQKYSEHAWSCPMFDDPSGRTARCRDSLVWDADPEFNVVLSKSQMERILLAIWQPGVDMAPADVAILTAMNKGVAR
jgi:hypothetical protein